MQQREPPTEDMVSSKFRDEINAALIEFELTVILSQYRYELIICRDERRSFIRNLMYHSFIQGNMGKTRRENWNKPEIAYSMFRPSLLSTVDSVGLQTVLLQSSRVACMYTNYYQCRCLTTLAKD